MPDILHHLDRYVDKMKKKVNNKIDRIGHNSKFDTADFKKSHKNSYWDNNDKPNRKKSRGETMLRLFLTLLIVISIICVIMFLNANILFLIKIASPAFIDKMFPTNCNAPPFGTKSTCMCPPCHKWSDEEVKAIEQKLEIENADAGVGGGLSCKPKGEFPYDQFDNAGEGIKEQIGRASCRERV